MWIEDVEGEFAARGFREAVLTEGLSAPPLRAWEGGARVSSSALIQWFGSKQRILPRAAGAYAVRMDYLLRELGWDGFLPQCTSDHEDLRVWAAWQEVGAQRPEVAERLAPFHAEAHTLLEARLTGADDPIRGLAPLPPELRPTGADQDQLALVELVLTGLWHRAAGGELTQSDRALWSDLPGLITVPGRWGDGSSY